MSRLQPRQTMTPVTDWRIEAVEFKKERERPLQVTLDLGEVARPVQSGGYPGGDG